MLSSLPSELPAMVGVLPFFHIYGMNVIMNLGLLRCATGATLPRFDLEAFLIVLQEWPIPLAHIVPPSAVALAKHPPVESLRSPQREMAVLRRRAVRRRTRRQGRRSGAGH
jgi:acyl-CoA synthetase (AMP-forming)/AMP-acid ligase II